MAAEAEREAQRPQLAAEPCADLEQTAAGAGAEAEKKPIAAEAEKQVEDDRQKRALDEAAERQLEVAQQVKEEQLAAEQEKRLASRRAAEAAKAQQDRLAAEAAASAEIMRMAFEAEKQLEDARKKRASEMQLAAAQQVKYTQLAANKEKRPVARRAAEAAMAQQDRLAVEAAARAGKQRIALAEAGQERLEAQHQNTAIAPGTSRERLSAPPTTGVLQRMPAGLRTIFTRETLHDNPCEPSLHRTATPEEGG